MNPLFYVAIASSVGAIAVLLHALVSAPDGFEDEEGFHAIRRPARNPHPSLSAPPPGSEVDPRFAPR